MRVVLKTLPRDLGALLVLLSLKRNMKQHTKNQKGIPSLFYETCDKNPNKICFIDVMRNKRWSYTDFDRYSNQVANYFLSLGYQPGESVAIFMESSVEYVALWLGLSKIGVVPALINYNLRLESLVHCLEAAGVRSLLYGLELQDAVDEASPIISKSIQLLKLGSSEIQSSLDHEISSASASRPPGLVYDFNSPLIYIYTSGTTGLPKAAKVAHSRFFYMTNSVHQFADLNSSTVVYNTLPLYHSAGGILGVGQALLQGLHLIWMIIKTSCYLNVI